MKRSGPFWVEKGSVPVATPLVILLPEAGDFSLVVTPSGTLGSSTVELSLSDPDDLLAGAATWIASTITAATAKSSLLRNGPATGVRISAAVGPTTYEFCQRQNA